jgi:hypothetical protein
MLNVSFVGCISHDDVWPNNSDGLPPHLLCFYFGSGYTRMNVQERCAQERCG